MSATGSTTDGIASGPRQWRRGPPTRYDLVLLVIPLAFALALVGAWTGPLAVHHAMFAASVGAAALVVDALFRNPPQGPTRRGR